MMSKTSADGSKLRVEANRITERLLEEAIKLKESRDDVVIRNFRVSPGSGKGENVASVVFMVEVTADVGKNRTTYPLFVKTNPDLEVRKKWAFEKSMIFHKEAMMYFELVPAMLKLQNEKCGYVPGPSVPIYYYSKISSDEAIVVLHNHQPDGYSIVNGHRGLDFDHCKLVMKEIAVFHALSWAMKDINPDSLKQYPFLSINTFFQDTVHPLLDQGVSSFVDLVKSRMSDGQIRSFAVKLQSLDLLKTLRRLHQPIEPYAVVCHGDLHFNNLLFRADDSTKNAHPADLKLIDLQTVQYALPTTDLAMFFFISTTGTTRKHHLKQLLLLYHTEFNNCLGRLGIVFPGFTMSVLEDLFAQSALLGLLLSCMFLPLFLCDSQDVAEFSGETHEEKEEEMRGFMKRLPQLCDNSPVIQERLFDNFIDIIEMNSL